VCQYTQWLLFRAHSRLPALLVPISFTQPILHYFLIPPFAKDIGHRLVLGLVHLALDHSQEFQPLGVTGVNVVLVKC
jgi:hypothetical protein